jgi:hypothetical protein
MKSPAIIFAPFSVNLDLPPLLGVFYEGSVVFYRTFVEFYKRSGAFYESLVMFYGTLVEHYEGSVVFYQTIVPFY